MRWYIVRRVVALAATLFFVSGLVFVVVRVLPGDPALLIMGTEGSPEATARRRRDLFTDLDVLVVWKTDRALLERLRSLYSLLDVAVDMDVICYTPAEFEEMRDRPFLRQVLREEVLLFEKKPS